MKTKKLKHKKAVFFLVALLILLFVLSIFRLVFALKAVQILFIAQHKTEAEAVFLNDGKAKEYQKEIYWLEQQLELSKSDSISLGINLSGNIVQIELKGTTLYQAEILKKSPDDFLQFLDGSTYFNFAKASNINKENVNIPKKPVKKMLAPKDEAEAQLITHAVKTDPFIYWDFTTNNHFRVVIIGVPVNADSSFVIRKQRDIQKTRVHDFFQNPLPKSYSPVLYVWMKDMEAKTIYRAIPEKSRILFRN